MNDVKNNDIVRKLSGLSFSVYQAGSRIDKDTKEDIEYEKGISIRRDENFINLSAVECAFLAQCFQESGIKEELVHRLKEERKIISNFIVDIEY